MEVNKGVTMTQMIRTFLVGVVAICFAALPAAADVDTENYVEVKANEVLATLNDPSLDDAARTAAFSTFMDAFADIRSVSRFVLGRYAKRIEKDEFETFAEAFRTYMLVVYEVELDRYRGEEVVVLGSDIIQERTVRGQVRRVIDVNTIIPQENGDPFKLDWRVAHNDNDNEYKVVDVGLRFDGQHIWLGDYQRNVFTSLLSQNSGDTQVLLDWMDRETKLLEDERQKTVQAASGASESSETRQN